MDFKKSKAPVNTVTRNIMDLCDDTHNIYESVAIIAKRANQISIEIKQELSKKLQEFASYNDSLEEVFENREQIEISRYYEKLPKPTLLATEEFIENNIYWRDPTKTSEPMAHATENPSSRAICYSVNRHYFCSLLSSPLLFVFSFLSPASQLRRWEETLLFITSEW